jgi:hypothetical protein
MFCGKCGAPIPINAKFCPRCGHPVLGVQASVPLPPIPSSTASTAEGNSRWRMLATVGGGIYLTVVLVIFTLYSVHQTDDWAYAVGHAIGVALIPSVVVLLYYKYSKKQQQASLARRLSVLASWILIANMISIGREGSHLTTADVPIIAREAADLVPITDPSDTGRTAVRECFKEIIARNKDYQSKVATLNWESLYTPQSYLDAQEANRVIVQVDDASRIEEEQTSVLEKIETSCEARINSLDWPEGEKKEFIKGFSEKYRKTLRDRVPLLTTEKEWLSSVRDLYTFVLDNQRYFRPSGSTVIIPNSEVREAFNSKIDHANGLRKEYQESMTAFEQKEKENSAAIGVSLHDFGLSQ